MKHKKNYSVEWIELSLQRERKRTWLGVSDYSFKSDIKTAMYCYEKSLLLLFVTPQHLYLACHSGVQNVDQFKSISDGAAPGYLQQCSHNLSLMENLLLIDLHFAMPASHTPIMTAVKSIQGLSIHLMWSHSTLFTDLFILKWYYYSFFWH